LKNNAINSSGQKVQFIEKNKDNRNITETWLGSPHAGRDFKSCLGIKLLSVEL